MSLISNFFHKVSSINYLAVVLSFCVIVFAAYHADKMTQRALLDDLEDDVTKELNLIKTKVEGELNSNIQLVRGLVYTIKTEPLIDQTRFSQLAKQIFYEESLLNVVAAAPDLVNKVIYPFDEYKKMIGLDYNAKPELLQAALEAKALDKVVLAGPIELKIGGGLGIIARYPITIEQDGKSNFWGMVSAVISIDKLLALSGLNQTSLPINVAIEKNSKDGSPVNRFYGGYSLTDDNAIAIEMELPVSSWKFYAAPKGGWIIPSNILLYERVIIGLLSIFLFLPIVFVSRYAEQKRKALVLLAEREQELASAYADAEYLSLHDHLTELPNRRYLQNHTRELNAQEQDSDKLISVFAIDLDNFKQINDRLGHAAGDAVLVHVANILTMCIGLNDFVARTGGDEFVILSQENVSKDSADRICNKIITELEKPFTYAGQPHQIGVSIGVCLPQKDTPSVYELMKDADQALYTAKVQGRNNHYIYVSA